MDIGVYDIESIGSEKTIEMLKSRRSFVLNNVSRTLMPEAVETLEKHIESLDMKCRVYSKGRSAGIAALGIPTPVTWAVGAATALTIGVHNVVTWSPDYEIAKNLAMGTLTVTCKKDNVD